MPSKNSQTRRGFLAAAVPAALMAQDRGLAEQARRSYESGDFAEAARAMEDLLKAISANASSAQKAPVLATAGLYQTRAGGIQRAEALLRQAVDLAGQGGSTHDLAIARRNLAALLVITERKGATEEAVKLARLAAEGLTGSNTGDEAQAKLLLVRLNGVPASDAAKLVDDAIAIIVQDTGRTSAGYAKALIAKARFQGKAGAETVREADRILNAVLPADHPDRLVRMFQQAVPLINQHDLRAAECLLVPAINGMRKKLGTRHYEVADMLYSLAPLRHWQERDPEAIAALRELVSIRQNIFGPTSVKVARGQTLLALLLQESDQYDDSKNRFENAIAIMEDYYGPDNTRLIEPLQNLSITLECLGEEGEAVKLLERCLKLTKPTKDGPHPGLPRVLETLAIVKWKQGHTAEALSLFRQGEPLMERQIQEVLSSATEPQKREYLKKMENLTNLVRSFHVLGAPKDPDVLEIGLVTVLRRKGRVLESLLEDTASARNNKEDASARAMLDELFQLRSERARLGTSYLNNQSTEDSRLAAGLVVRERQLETQIGRTNRVLGSYVESADLKTISGKLPKNSVLIEIAEFRAFNPAEKKWTKRWQKEEYTAFFLFPDRPPDWCKLGLASPLNKLAFDYRLALGDPKTAATAAALGTQLYAKLISPIASRIEGRSHLILAPDGPLNLVPFGALRGEDERYLIERFAISYCSSAREALRWKLPSEQTTPAAIFAAPDFGVPDGSRALTAMPLFGLAQEAGQIENILKKAGMAPRTFQGAKASKTELKGIASPRILHLATHGIFLGSDYSGPAGTKRAIRYGGPATIVEKPDCDAGNQPVEPTITPLLRSVLLLAGANRQPVGPDDGVLTALEVSALPLSGTELVVLSACETGLGEIDTGEGIHGLRRAFTLAGARSQILSLWKVHDAATLNLMVDFYKFLIQRNMPRAEALRQAQLRMLRRNPYYWAAFIAAGDPGPLNLN